MERSRSSSPLRPSDARPRVRPGTGNAPATRPLRRTHPAAPAADLPRLGHALRKLLRELHTEPEDPALQRQCWLEVVLACPQAELTPAQMPRNAHDVVALVLALMVTSDPVAKAPVEALTRCLTNALRSPATVLDLNALDDCVVADFIALGGLRAFAIDRNRLLPPVKALVMPPLLSDTRHLGSFPDLTAVCFFAPDAEALDLTRWQNLRYVLVINPEEPHLRHQLLAPPGCEVEVVTYPGDAFTGHETPIWQRLVKLDALLAPLWAGPDAGCAALRDALAGQLVAPSRVLSLRDVSSECALAFAQRGGMARFAALRNTMHPPLTTVWIPANEHECPHYLRRFPDLQHLVVHEPSDILCLNQLRGLKSVTFVNADEEYVDPSTLPLHCALIVETGSPEQPPAEGITAPLPPLPGRRHRRHERPV